MIEISAALSSAKALLDIAKGAVDARDDAKVRGALADLQLKLFDAMSAALAAQEKNAALLEQTAELRRELQELKQKSEERDRYTLTQLCAGAYAYANDPAQDGKSEPAHYLCQACFDKGVKAVLRYTPPRMGSDGSWVCPEQKEHRIQHHGTEMPISLPGRY